MYSVKMMDMGKTPEEVKEEKDKYSSPMPISDVINRYPYGLCISLTGAELEKLKLPVPDAGDMIHIFAMAKVTSVSQNETADGKKCCRAELQITHLGLENEDDESGDEEEAA